MRSGCRQVSRSMRRVWALEASCQSIRCKTWIQPGPAWFEAVSRWPKVISNLKSLLETGSAVLQDPYRIANAHSETAQRRARGSVLPELAGGDASAFGHRGHLRPDDVGIDRGLSDPCAEAAVAPGDHVFPADKLRVTADALRDQLRMLDEVGFRFDHTGNQQLAI